MPRILRSSYTVLSLVAACALTIGCSANQSVDQAQQLIENEKLAVYRGWLKFLVFDVDVVAKRPGVSPEDARAKQERLEDWVTRISQDPDTIYNLRGVQEWAYESQADGSGQPFMINIPYDYERGQPLPLSLYMHGLSGTHSAHYSGTPNLKGLFELSVMGRARGGGYVGLAGADVIDALDYVEATWSIDADRVHLSGGSMGGHGTFRMASRYPHRFASARPTCGFAAIKPAGNFLTMPIYATHSDDDPVVSVMHAAGTLERVRELGGQVIFDRTNGLGHAAWDYAEGNARSDAWFRKQVRPRSSDVRKINYTAMDGGAVRSWWAEVEEWGDKPRPARFSITAGSGNHLYVELENVEQLKLYVDESPLDRSESLRVSVAGMPVVSMSAPLPDIVYLKNGDLGWELATNTDSSAVRRHTPGGPNLLYNGEPFLIVYGTTGTSKENAALLEAAKVASANSTAVWASPNGDLGSDEIAHSRNLYGHLKIIADRDLSEEEIRRSHLVLIGTAEQNQAVAAIAEALPVSLRNGEIQFEDGESYEANGLGIGLVHYNPSSPSRLIFWVASEDEGAYAADSYIPAGMAFQLPMYENPAPGYDCLVSEIETGAMIAARSFDSAWNWLPRSGSEQVIEDDAADLTAFINGVAQKMGSLVGSDYAFSSTFPNRTALMHKNGVTRINDFVSKYYYEPVGVIEVSGAELSRIQVGLRDSGMALSSSSGEAEVDPDAVYTIAITPTSIWGFVNASGVTPTRYRLTDTVFSEVIESYLLGD